MSANEDNQNEGDLIDLHVGSPVLPRPCPSNESIPHSPTFDNLIDSELPVLEQRLQTTSDSNDRCCGLATVDVEDILIAIDDDDLHPKRNPVRRSNSENILGDGQTSFKGQIDKSISCDNLEALSVLQSLDELLNASLLESDKILQSDDNQDNIEACLLDLDTYLQALECSEETSNGDDQPSSLQSETSSLQSTDSSTLRAKLRQFEVNYTKFLASGYVNRGFVADSDEHCRKPQQQDRPLSACGIRRVHASHQPHRASTIAVVKPKERPVLHDPQARCDTAERTSGAITPLTAADHSSDSEDIDWSWVQDVARDVSLERRAHAAGDCCTGTVVVEPLHRALTEEEPPSGEGMAAQSDKEQRRLNNTWLRTSMRRLRHFRMPSNDSNDAVVVTTTMPSDAPSAAVDHVADLAVVRPVSAPSRLIIPSINAGNSAVPSNRSSRSREVEQNVSHEPAGRARSSSASSRSRRPRSLSSSVSSLASTVDSTPSCTPAPTPTHVEPEQQGNQRRPCENRNRQNDMPETESPLGQWPHSLSSMMACLGCTLGLFNISRFAILTVHFGANFIFQFFFLSMVFGLPLFTLQLCLGQQLGAGVVDMWRISPLFQGVGVALLVAQTLMGLYSIIGVSWMFVFFRDSFITKMDRYRWAEPFLYYRDGVQAPINGTYKLSETIPDYFSGIVLQRHHLPREQTYGTIKFQLAFNLAVVWMIVFVSLSKGLRSYGKVIYVFTLLPVFGTFVLCAKILGMMPPEYINIIFPETTWNEFFLNPKCWLAAAQEVFLTWGILGAAVMQIASHNKHKHLLQRDSSLVAVITFTILLLVAFLANTCVQILRSYGYNYLPNSFEQISSYTFLRSMREPLPPSLASTPVRYMVHNSFFVGEKVVRPGVDFTVESGYQALRLATELIPATFAALGADQVSPFWAVLFYFILILFGIAQQLAIWHSVITGIMAIRAKVLKSWETTITLFSCACGFILGLPMATEFGIYVVYFMDYTIGGIWWIILIILLQIVAVFMVRGRPYSGDTVVTALFNSTNHPCVLTWAPALLSFTWNVILPVALMVLCISTFKNGNFREIFIWHHAPIAEYWPLWARQLGSMLQLIPILIVPLVAVIQSYRYLNSGPNDILERIQLLYRPPIGEHMTDLQVHEAAIASLNNNTTSSTQNNPAAEDPPPKYTPPPSYTTATGARIAKFLRQSIRRSVRRLANVLGESSGGARQRGVIPNQPPPPDYNAVLVEMSQTNSTDLSIVMPEMSLSPPPPQAVRISTLERLRNVQATPGSPTLTAAQVASILRSSFRRSTARRMVRNGGGVRSNANFNDDINASLSAENLVESAAPIGETSLVMEHLPDDLKRETNLNASVI